MATSKHLHRRALVIHDQHQYDRAWRRRDELSDKLDDGIELSHAEASELADLEVALNVYEDTLDPEPAR